MLAYHDFFQQFPLGAVNSTSFFCIDPTHHGTFLVELLPYIDQQAFYLQLTMTADTEYSVLGNGKYAHQTPIPVYLCPSDDPTTYYNTWPAPYGPNGYASLVASTGCSGEPADLTQMRAVANYAPSMGNQTFADGCVPGGNMFGTGPVSHGDTMNGTQISGIVSHMAWSASIPMITDGQSITIAVGEMRPKCSWHARDGWMHIDAMWFATTAPINYPTCPGEPSYNATSCNNEADWGTAQGFKSLHTGGANFVMCDGSVHFISEAIDYTTYQRLGDRRDGQAITYNWVQ